MGKPEPSDVPVKTALGQLWTLVENKYYFDELYALDREIRAGHDRDDV